MVKCGMMGPQVVAAKEVGVRKVRFVSFLLVIALFSSYRLEGARRGLL